MLISADDLRSRLRAGEQFVPVDVRDKAQWLEQTLPAASHLNVYDYFIPDSTEFGIQCMAKAFYHAWLQLKLSDSVTPVFFEQQVGMRSPRGAWFARVCGIDKALILDGGLEAWQAAGGELLPGSGFSAVISQEFIDVPAVPGVVRKLVATREEVIGAAKQQVTLVDARRPTEFSGEFAHDCCQRAGRIAGAKLLFWEDVLQNGHFLDADTLRQRAQRAGLSPDQRQIIYCHRGARAATVLAALERAGYRQLAIYVGSWHEWAEHGELPVSSDF